MSAKKFLLAPLVVFLFSFLFCSIQAVAQVWTIVHANGKTGIKIVDPDGVRSWTAFRHNQTNVKVDGENPVPGDCPKTYIKDPTANLKGGAKYWILYRDCDGQPGNKTEVEATFYNDASHRDQWVEAVVKPIPDPENKTWLYYGVGGLLFLIILYFIFRRKK